MTANVPAPRPQVHAGGQVAAIVPQTMDEAFRVSQAIALSGLAPRGIDKPEQIMVAIMAGAELGLAPFQALQSFAVVNGRPTLWGDGLMAVVRARGVRVKEWLDGEGDQMVAHCLATRPDTGEEIERAFTVADAKKAALWGKTGPWTQYPKRMLQMRARALALRDGCADMLRGIQIREEVEDYQHIRDVTPQKSGIMARLPGSHTGEGFHANVVEQGMATEQPKAPEEIDAVLEHDEPSDFPASNPSADEGERAAESNPPQSSAQASDDFPGDRPSSSTATAPDEPNKPSGEGGGLTLAQRAAAFRKRCAEASGTAKLSGIWNASVELRNDLDDKDPDLLSDLTNHWQAAFDAAETREKGG